jgi:hypothetical protein
MRCTLLFVRNCVHQAPGLIVFTAVNPKFARYRASRSHSYGSFCKNCASYVSKRPRCSSIARSENLAAQDAYSCSALRIGAHALSFASPHRTRNTLLRYIYRLLQRDPCANSANLTHRHPSPVLPRPSAQASSSSREIISAI